MALDRIIGGMAIAFGAFLLLYGIPANVRMVSGMMPYPALFPQIGAWMFIVLGAIQLGLGRDSFEFPGIRQFGVFLGVVGLTLLAVLGLERFGYLTVMIPLLAALALVSGERRWPWIAGIALGLPLCVWALFEFVLQRGLP
ncbi:tripartite tricarboxylate transporter TctB family protein [Chachezhania antarctica]|uniref:tripartite tricarboxylate transporter TctB family protein n=1 Tax=Chachezhania antarctica TaxID=2340860 RepID=UPI000EAE57ED|nr:tripartite tricarboxylate transporter TctB family protein [Chachezhania antarctica]|tara:strand:- start:2441 stop:2863 length:423 start_codon:yes stop_codon:yes gene_type:complete